MRKASLRHAFRLGAVSDVAFKLRLIRKPYAAVRLEVYSNGIPEAEI